MDKQILFTDSYAYKLWYEFESEEHYEEVLNRLSGIDEDNIYYQLRGDALDNDYNSAFDIMDMSDRVVIKCQGNKLTYGESTFEEPIY